MTPLDRAQRTVLVSGSSTGIGRATVLALAHAGWRVLAGVRRTGDAPSAPPGASGSVEPVVLDVADPASVLAARSTVERWTAGRPLDALVNNAGIGVLAPMQTVDPEELLALWQVNVLGVVRLTQALLPSMTAGSRLVVVGSVGDRITVPFGGALTSSKAAVASVAEAFRLELATRDIAVTIIEPGSIRTDAVDKIETALDVAVAEVAATDPELADRFGRAARVGIGHERRGSDPVVVARAIVRTLDAPHPRTRVLVGRHARRLAILAAALPDPLLDRLRLRLFDQRRASAPARPLMGTARRV